MPPIFALRSPVAAMIRSSSPIPSLCFFAVSASTITSVGPRGACPEVISIDRRSFFVQLLAMVGAPVCEPMFSFSLLTTVTAMENAEPSARSTPSAFATCWTTEAGRDAGFPFPGCSSAPSASFGLTVTSGEEMVKSLSKVVFIVSVNTSVPQTNATESSTATAERAIRPLCARKLRTEVFQTVMTSARGRRSSSCGRGPARRSGGASRRRWSRRRDTAPGPRRRRRRGRG